jgi:hypothetical protein
MITIFSIRLWWTIISSETVLDILRDRVLKLLKRFRGFKEPSS